MNGENIESVRTRAVIYMEKIKGITDATAKKETDLAGGILVTMQLKKDGRETWGWYFEREDKKKALFTGEEIATYVSSELTQKSAVRNIVSAFTSTTSHAVSSILAQQ